MSGSQVNEVLFVAFNRRVIALDRETGADIWAWQAPQGHGFVALLLDGDRLFASVSGYTYCLDPLTGEQLWFNPMEGCGYGIPTLVTARGSTLSDSCAAAQAEEDEHKKDD